MPPPRHRIAPTLKLFKRLGDRQEWKCNQCHNLFESTAQIDHIKPLKLGGSNELENLQILCVSCHAKKTQDETDVKIKLTQYAIKGTHVEEQRLTEELRQVRQDRDEFEESARVLNIERQILIGKRLIDCIERLKSTQQAGNSKNFERQSAKREGFYKAVYEIEGLLREVLSDDTAQLFDKRGDLNPRRFPVNDTVTTSVQDCFQGLYHLKMILYTFWNPDFCKIAMETQVSLCTGRTVTTYRHSSLDKLMKDYVRPHLKGLRT